MDIEIIKFLRDISNPVIDWLFYGITQIGGEIFFIVIGAILYWTINKKYAHKFVLTFLLISVINLGLKAIFKRPRPYTVDGIDAPLDYYTSGYSFPSGHASSSAVLGLVSFDGAKKTNYKWLKYVGIAIMVLVPFSRMILAQHYFSDVLVGLAISYVLAFYFFKLIDKFNDKEEYYTLALVPILLIIMLIVQDADLYVAGGAFLGFAVGYYLEKHYVKYDVRNKLSTQILKIVIGFAGVLIIKEVPKLIFNDSALFDFIRYACIGGWVAVLAPLVFKYVFKHKKEEV